MFFFVKSEVSPDKVDELTRKIANKEITTPLGNFSFVTTDGCVGYDLIECRDEADCRQKYSALQEYLTIREMTPIEPMGQFLERWKHQRQAA